MNQFLPIIQVNGIGIVLMIIILFSLSGNSKSGTLADKIFFLLTFSVLLVCFLEIMGTVLNGLEFHGAIFLNRLFNALLFAANPIPAFLWAVYAYYKIYGNDGKIKSTARLLAIPLAIVVILSFTNMFTDIFFTITPDNIYERTNYFFVATLLSVFYMVYVTAIIIIQRKNIGGRLVVPLLSFMILPAIGLTLQFMFYGLYLIWVSVAISIIIIFNHVQNDYSITDWLTGAFNRKHLDNYLQQMCKRKRDNLLAGLMLDVDSFKNINDEHGHLAGDKALKVVAKSLKLALGKKAYVARYGGDEFVTILQVSCEEEIIESIDKINETLHSLINLHKNAFDLSLSIGYAIFKGQDNETTEEFLSRMDGAMYLVKNKN